MYDFYELQGIARILQHCLAAYPETELVNALIDNQVAQSWPEFNNTQENSEGRMALVAYLAQWHSNQLIELKLDYGQLFYGPGDPKAAPWGSVYLGEQQILNDDSTIALMDFYAANQIQVERPQNQPVDHLSLVFAVLDSILGELAENPDNQQLKQLTNVLLQQHVMTWAPRCLTLAISHAETDLYRGLALLALDYLNQLSHVFAVIPKTVKLYR